MTTPLAELPPPPAELGAQPLADGWEVVIRPGLGRVGRVLVVGIAMLAGLAPALAVLRGVELEYMGFMSMLGATVVAGAASLVVFAAAHHRIYGIRLEIRPSGVRVNGRLVPGHELGEIRSRRGGDSLHSGRSDAVVHEIELGGRTLVADLRDEEAQWLISAFEAVHAPMASPDDRARAARDLAPVVGRARSSEG